MAGQGPLPKPANQRARGNKDIIPTRIMHIHSAPQPELPSIHVSVKGELVEFTWPAQTLEWWDMWGRSPLTADFTENDWSELRDTAHYHARLWRGDLSVGAELRQRAAKFGATPEDRARLRIVFAQADQIEDKPAPSVSTRDRRGPLRAAG